MAAPLYVAAREVLLDALEALGPQRDALILGGAQAIYVHTGAADLAVAEFTSDGDLVVDPSLLHTDPRLAEALAEKFRPGNQPGTWLRDRAVEGIVTAIPVDLLVPEAVAGEGGRRAARMGDHGDRTGRRVRGLEGALVDHAPILLPALDPNDVRVFEIRVAGPSALLVAKLHKLKDRSEEPSARRLKDKDALDVLRLLRAVAVETLANGLRELSESQIAGSVTVEAIEQLHVLFGTTSAAGTQMAVRATERLEDPEAIAASCAALADDLLQALQ